MSLYKVATGHNVAAPSLNLFAPQPRCPGGIQSTQRTYGTSGKVHQAGLFAELLWNTLPNATVYQAILTQCGLSATVLESSVTVNLRNGVYTYARYNALAILPEPGKDVTQDDYFFRNLTLLLRNLVPL